MPCDDGKPRCAWALSDPLSLAYHDDEWGVPCWDDRELFARLMLEGFQAGLSWRLILEKRPRFASAFHGWDPERIAAFGPDDVARLLADPGIIRNRRKIEGAITNARAYLRLVESEGSFSRYLWSFTGGAPVQKSAPASLADVPAHTPESAAMAKDLRRRGFTFVGPTICYAFMQSVGMVNDHLAGCFRAES
jgi:DNA-3-methyladenine glycosylase I